MIEERVQKILAQAGYGSRRSCEELIEQGRVIVNGKKVILGQKADSETDQISVDGKPIPRPKSPRYIALYKPRFVLSDKTEEDPRRTVFEMVDNGSELAVVGRLDYESEGLILLTNDGYIVNRLTHPRYQHEKEYRVLLARRPDEKQIETWRRGVVLEDGDKTAPADVSFLSTAGKGAWIRVVMGEGKKRQIREVGRLLGLPVVKIIRLRIGTLRLGSLKPRQWRYLTADEVAELKGETKTPKPLLGRRTGRTAQKPLNPKDKPKRSTQKPLNPKDKSKRPFPKRTDKPFK